jgi:hypothetical protein
MCEKKRLPNYVRHVKVIYSKGLTINDLQDYQMIIKIFLLTKDKFFFLKFMTLQIILMKNIINNIRKIIKKSKKI